jgi:PIN domain nuclease of toxin-antitoxin system
MIETVLDSSALLAILFGEPGGDTVLAAVPTSAMSAANLAEVVSKLIARGADEDSAVRTAQESEMEVVAVDQRQAEIAGLLHARSRRLGISMGDAFCLALAETLGLPILTTDGRLAEAATVEVRLIR